MDTLIQDLRYALRTLVRGPGFALVAILTLALGIGANSAIFSVVHAVLLRPLPFEEPERLVMVNHFSDGQRSTLSPRNFLDVAEQVRSLESLSAMLPRGTTLTGRGEPARLDGAEVSASFFRAMRARTVLGRTFRPEENQPGANRVVVLGHALWQERFGGDRGVVGRTITLDGNPHTVIGVMEEGFVFPSNRQLWVPLEYDASFVSDESRGAWYLTSVGRLRPGATLEGANAEIRTLFARLEKQYPESNTGLGAIATPLHEMVVGKVRPALLILLGAVGLVLLIACANVANLMLARAATREGEIAVRAALGAGRGRLLRQLLTESLVLSLLGAGLGLLLAFWGTEALVALKPQGIPRLDGVGVSGPVVAFTAAVALLTGIGFGLFPALQVARPELAETLRGGGRGAVSGPRAGRVRRLLVVGEMALAVMLLAGAGLLLRSFSELRSVDPGFQPERTLALELSVPEASYDNDARVVAFYDRLLERLRGLPGVRSAGAVSALPLTGTNMVLTFGVEGRPPAPVGQEPVLQVRSATPDYFRTMGIRLVRGRGFTPADRAGAPPVVVITEETVRRHFAGQDPIGQRIRMDWTRDSVNVGGTVVGVVADVKQSGLADAFEPEIYFPSAQVPFGGMDVVLRTVGDPTALAAAAQREVRALDAALPVTSVRTVEEIVTDSVSQPRFYMLLLTLFAAVALTLAAVGIFGVMSYSVVQRTREIGIRMALGAEPGQVLRQIVGGGALLAAMGVGLGLLLSLAVTRMLAGLLFGVSPTDPLTLGAVVLVLGGAALVACYIPARRATRVDPVSALRAD